jgi:hypothetical protein
LRLPKKLAYRPQSLRRSSSPGNGEFAVITREGDKILVRSSLTPHKVVTYTQDEFRALRLAILAGEFDDLG